MKTDELKDKIYQAIGHAANADGIINQALATEYVMVNILTELSPTPSSLWEGAETTETTARFSNQNTGGYDCGNFHNLYDGQFTHRIYGHDSQDAESKVELIVTAVNSYSQLKAENERLKSNWDNALAVCNEMSDDNEAKEKRLKELEELLHLVNVEMELREVTGDRKLMFSDTLTNKINALKK